MVSTEKTSPNDENSEDQDEAQTIENHTKDATIIENSDDEEVVGVVNLMPKFMVKNLGITVDKLSRSRLIIQGFNQGEQKAIGMIRAKLTISELQAKTLFHVINAMTSYNLLLGRPWIHSNGIIPLTLHQCFKCNKNGI
ncbi:uncharacterized protein LOC132309051 [Cornus florida]|uniref:uncharacterized protein LOC132309051 n=1 Tax=Cornus florida TaxID=4283 RepID=UPI0028A27E45|nr:uncharacterized protein LOC132309051 [Cornus florida]